jgi:hypothetical protein
VKPTVNTQASPTSNWGKELERVKTHPFDQLTEEGFILVKLVLF